MSILYSLFNSIVATFVVYFLWRLILRTGSEKDLLQRVKTAIHIRVADLGPISIGWFIVFLFSPIFFYYDNLLGYLFIAFIVITFGFILQSILNLLFTKFSRNSKKSSQSPAIRQKSPSPTSANTKSSKPLIFISYRRIDSNDITGRIYDRLIQILPRESVFKDVDSIPFGVDFREYVADMIQTCDIVLTVIGTDWLTVTDANGYRRLDNVGDFVRIEIEEALARNIRVIPLLVRGASMPTEADLPKGLKKLAFRNGVAIRPDPDFHNDMNRLMRDIGLMK